MTLPERYKQILLSPRFHQALGIFVVQSLAHYGIIDAYMANALSVLLGISITVSTVDRAADAVGSTPVIVNAPIEQTVNPTPDTAPTA